MDPNRLVLRGGSILPAPSAMSQGRAADGPATDVLLMAAPGIVGALTFFLLMFALVAAYWRCRRLKPYDSAAGKDGYSTGIPRGNCCEPLGGNDLKGCRIIVNPLLEQEGTSLLIPLTPLTRTTAAASFGRTKVPNELDSDFSDLESLLSACSGGRVGGGGGNEDCDVCRRESAGSGAARLASSEDELDDDEFDDDEVDVEGEATAIFRKS